MRNMMVLGAGLFLLAACGGNPTVPPKVTWGYGAGNGDSVQSGGPPPRFSFANGLGQDMPVAAGQMPKVSYGYGEEQKSGLMVNMAPAATPTQQVASPAPVTPHPALAPAPGVHS